MKRFMKALSAAFAVLSTMLLSVNAFAATHDHATPGEATPGEAAGGSPWIRLISFGIIVLIIVVIFILSKTNTKLGLRINKFFKEYASEIKKVVWFSKKDTLKATGVVLAILIVAAVAIGVLDLGFTKLIQLLANIF